MSDFARENLRQQILLWRLEIQRQLIANAPPVLCLEEGQQYEYRDFRQTTQPLTRNPYSYEFPFLDPGTGFVFRPNGTYHPTPGIRSRFDLVRTHTPISTEHPEAKDDWEEYHRRAAEEKRLQIATDLALSQHMSQMAMNTDYGHRLSAQTTTLPTPPVVEQEPPRTPTKDACPPSPRKPRKPRRSLKPKAFKKLQPSEQIQYRHELIERAKTFAALSGQPIEGSKLVRDFCRACGEAIRVVDACNFNLCHVCNPTGVPGHSVSYLTHNEIIYHGNRHRNGEW